MSYLIMPISITRIAIAIMACVLLSACDHGVTTSQWQMTTTIKTPLGIKVGKTVITAGSKKILSLEGWAGAGVVKGQAAIINISSKERLYITLSEGSRDYAVQMIGLAGRNTFRNLPKGGIPKGSIVTLKPEHYPKFVMFGNEKDPETAVSLDTFLGGMGSVISITFQETDAPISTGIERYLPWVDTYPSAFPASQNVPGIRPSNLYPLNRDMFKVDTV